MSKFELITGVTFTTKFGVAESDCDCWVSFDEYKRKMGELAEKCDRLEATVRDREAEILRIQTHETAAAHSLDSQLSPEERAQFKALADENARLWREIHALRLFGNKDCTAMADDYLRGESVDLKGD
jgi:hypothetical protein